MCLSVDQKATELAKRESKTVTRYKVLRIAADDVVSPYHDTLKWKEGWNTARQDDTITQEMRDENKVRQIISDNAIHVYVHREDAEAEMSSWDRIFNGMFNPEISFQPYRRKYVVVEVECNTKYLLGVGTTGMQDDESEAYTSVFLKSLPKG